MSMIHTLLELLQSCVLLCHFVQEWEKYMCVNRNVFQLEVKKVNFCPMSMSDLFFVIAKMLFVRLKKLQCFIVGIYSLDIIKVFNFRSISFRVDMRISFIFNFAYGEFVKCGFLGGRNGLS